MQPPGAGVNQYVVIEFWWVVNRCCEFGGAGQGTSLGRHYTHLGHQFWNTNREALTQPHLSHDHRSTSAVTGLTNLSPLVSLQWSHGMLRDAPALADSRCPASAPEEPIATPTMRPPAGPPDCLTWGQSIPVLGETVTLCGTPASSYPETPKSLSLAVLGAEGRQVLRLLRLAERPGQRHRWLRPTSFASCGSSNSCCH